MTTSKKERFAASLEALKKLLEETPIDELVEQLHACSGGGGPTVEEFSASLKIAMARNPESEASKTFLGRICQHWNDDQFLIDVIVKSMTDDVLVQVSKHSAIVIKGEFYEELEGRILQLKALDDGKIEVNGHSYRIESAELSKTARRKYDLILVGIAEGQERLDMTVEYAAVRKMIERKTSILDLDEDHRLLPTLNDMNEGGSFTLEGNEFYLCGEEWTQSKPGHRDIRLFAVGDFKDQRVITVSEDFIKDMIRTGSTSFDMPKA